MHEVEGSSPFETTIIQKIVHKQHDFLYFFVSCYDDFRTDAKEIEAIFDIYLLFRKF